MDGGGNLIRRATVEEMVAQRNRALALYAEAHTAIAAASAALVAAAREAGQSSRGTSRFNHHSEDERRGWLGSITVPDREAFLATARRLTDTDVWSAVIEHIGLERLMDKKAKDEFTRQLVSDPPEVTVDNIFATVEQFSLDAGMIFRRGIAECFSSLDRRFRSHDGWKIGARVILTNTFNTFGSWSYHRNERDTIQDIERTFLILDGRTPPPNYAGIVGAVEESRGHGFGKRQSLAETEYFRVRGFENGNAHIWFKRDDLVDRVNQLIGEYYGAPIPEDREPDADTGLHEPKTGLAKSHGWFPTPAAAADKLIEDASLYRHDGEPRLVVLEPSAGTGNLASRATARDAIVDCVEVHAERAATLRATRQYRRVTQSDFLALPPDPIYDRVIMNPPFDRERDIDHVLHALKFLKPDGLLVAIMSAGTEFRETRKSVAFRALVEKMRGWFQDLPERSFSESGTNCNTVILRIRMDGKKAYG